MKGEARVQRFHNVMSRKRARHRGTSPPTNTGAQTATTEGQTASDVTLVVAPKKRPSLFTPLHVWQALFAVLLATTAFLANRNAQVAKDVKEVKELNRELRERVDSVSTLNALLPQEKWRNFIRDEIRIDETTSSISILGITNARRLHLLRDALIRALDRNVEVKVLMLDPESREFAEREEFEEDSVGRLRLEIATGLATLREVWSRAKPENRERLHVRLFQMKPELAFSGFDLADSTRGEINVNAYPKEKGSRGFRGTLYTYFFRDERDRQSYLSNRNMYERVWVDSKARIVDFSRTKSPVDAIKALARQMARPKRPET